MLLHWDDTSEADCESELVLAWSQPSLWGTRMAFFFLRGLSISVALRLIAFMVAPAFDTSDLVDLVDSPPSFCLDGGMDEG